MNKYRIASAGQVVKMITASAALVLALSSASLSQTPGELTPAPSSNRPQSDINRLDMSEREFSVRHVALGGNRLVLESQRKLLYAQIREDFERIQELNKELVNTIAVQSSLDYKNLAKIAIEVKKRASRLKLNLAFPEPESAEKEQKSQDYVRPNQSLDKSIVMLDHSIVNFVSNALFKQGPGVINAQDAAKASRDLNSIIEMSDRLKNSVAQQGKSTK